MKKIIKKDFEIIICDICNKELNRPDNLGYTIDYEDMIREITDKKNFDAHFICIKDIIKEAFKKYIK